MFKNLRSEILILLFCQTVLAAEAAREAYRLEPIAKGFELAVHAAFAPGESDRMYVVEQAGRVRVWTKGKIENPAFLDIVPKVKSGGEMGLLSIAFHPKYVENRRFFVNYTATEPNLKTVIAEFGAKQKKETRLLEFDQPYPNHNGGHILFDRVGFLYIGNGDGGSAGDPENRAQDKNSLLGKILRIDVDGAGDGRPYRIPADNPFARGGGRGEIYAWGLRNPWRLSFDRRTGKMWAGDVGQDRVEEIDIIEKGANYGWRKMEGRHCFEPSTGCESKDLIPPVWEYGRGEGISITGGYVYRGKSMPGLTGAYVYADYGSGKIWAWRSEEEGKAARNEILLESGEPVTSFAEDPAGEILVVSHRGAIFRLTLR